MPSGAMPRLGIHMHARAAAVAAVAAPGGLPAHLLLAPRRAAAPRSAHHDVVGQPRLLRLVDPLHLVAMAQVHVGQVAVRQLLAPPGRRRAQPRAWHGQTAGGAAPRLLRRCPGAAPQVRWPSTGAAPGSRQAQQPRRLTAAPPGAWLPQQQWCDPSLPAATPASGSPPADIVRVGHGARAAHPAEQLLPHRHLQQLLLLACLLDGHRVAGAARLARLVQRQAPGPPPRPCPSLQAVLPGALGAGARARP
jgi:hypothetical protein